MRTLQDSEAPCFEKRMTHPMLQKNGRVILPMSFIRTYGHLLDTVISLTGPNGLTFSVAIRSYCYQLYRRGSELRHFLGHGWIEFVKRNGIRTGDCVIFKLKENSCFHVQVSSQLEQKVVFKTTPISLELCRCEKKGELGNNAREDDGKIPQNQVIRLQGKGTSNEATIIPKCEFNINSVDTPVKPWHVLARKNLNDVAVAKHRLLQEMDYIKHPGLDAAVSSNSRFPQFAHKLTKRNLRGRGHNVLHYIALPMRFAKEHGHKLQAPVELLGPCGWWRIVMLKVSSTVSSGIRVQFRCGWGAFSFENGFNEGS